MAHRDLSVTVKTVAFGLLLVGSIVAGCSKPVPPAGDLVTLRPGQTFEYVSHGTIEGMDVDGKVTNEFSKAEDSDGKPYLRKDTINEVKANGQTKTLTFSTYYRQDEKGSLYELGDSDDGWLSEPLLAVTSPMKIGQELSSESQYDSGKKISDHIKVTGVDLVEVPAGTYTAFVVENQHTSPRGVLNIKNWWVPSLAQSVKTEMSQGKLELTIELVKTGQLNL